MEDHIHIYFSNNVFMWSTTESRRPEIISLSYDAVLTWKLFPFY